MATAETAKLIASLELLDKFSRPLGHAEQKLGGFERKVSTLGRGASTAIGNIAKIGVAGAVAGIGLLVVNVKAGVDALNELENVTVATNTVLDSTKGVSGQTAKGIRDMSEGFEDLNATMDDKVIQSGANLLLTFTQIREKAFEPALEAALNMNEAMGGGPEGLQSTIIQVGKALNDPVRGATALRRVGVQLTKEQEKQIKTLVDQNDLYGAQRIILDELATEFGGRFAAAGKTAEGSQARLADRVEDVQKALSGPLIPAIDRARDKLIEVLGSPQVLAGAERLGTAIAGLFTDENLERGASMVEGFISKLTTTDFTTVTSGLGNVASTVGGLPWEAIGSAATLLGTGARALLDTFTSMPAWVQTAVLTGWGLNKLTGGVAGSLIGELGKGLIKGVLGMNAGVVNINAATVNGPGGPGLPGKGGGKGFPFLGVGGALAVPLILSGSDNPDANPTVQSHQDLTRMLEEGVISEAEFKRLWAEAYNESVNGTSGGRSKGGSFAPDLTAGFDRVMQKHAKTQEAMQHREDTLNASAHAADRAMLNSVRAATDRLGPRIDRVANTPHNVNTDVNLTVPVNISATVLANQLYRTQTSRSYSASTSTNTGGI